MDILMYGAILCIIFLLVSIFDVLRNALKELRQIREMLRTNQLVELQKVMDDADVKDSEKATD